MGRKAKFDDFEVAQIRASTKTGAQLAEQFGTSLLTIHNVRAYKGAYRDHVLDLGEPILNIHGAIVGIKQDTPETDEPLGSPARPPGQDSEDD